MRIATPHPGRYPRVMPARESSSPLSWSRVFDPLGEKMSAQLAGALIELRLDEEAQRRYDKLAGKNTEGQLSEEERMELTQVRQQSC